MRQISPSLVSADLGHLALAVKQAEEAGADRLHIDMEDGRFVPNFSLGFPVLEAVRRATALPLAVHLMVEEPEPHLSRVADLGADIIAVHLEVLPYPRRVLGAIRRLGRKAYLALNPRTPLGDLSYLSDLLDGLLLLSSEPDGMGDAFLPAVIPKVEAARRIWPELDIAVDGGVAREVAGRLWRAGATTLVAGRALFGHPDLAEAIRQLRGADGPTKGGGDR